MELVLYNVHIFSQFLKIVFEYFKSPLKKYGYKQIRIRIT